MSRIGNIGMESYSVDSLDSSQTRGRYTNRHSIGKTRGPVPQHQPLDRFRQFLFQIEAYDAYLSHKWSPVHHHPPFSREIEKTLLHSTVHSLWGKTMRQSLSPNNWNDVDNFYFI
ncbi:hypothetical protein AVEN_77742-1 [Araneus ventricosus]|uniref:Uncharacterized protein n=1 Tax=Araneus ventricosus TaxID=182803 RepID=A0A4Y2ILZ9_ARAVE|nr:hypothetical protein AVEN_77742-1 [Araneus ventricosus]